MKMNKLARGEAYKSHRGRPATRPSVLKDGFYFEVRNRSTEPGSGVKIWKSSHNEMLEGAEQYRKTKEVIILGAYKNGKPVISKPSPRKKAA